MDAFFSSIGWGNFIIVLGVLVFVHELGHYLVARWCGVRVEVFSIGFGPELVGWDDRHKTRWKICALPLGGYVKMFGERKDGGTDQEHSTGELTDEEMRVSFAHKNVWQRFAVVAAGPLANFIFAVFVFGAAAYVNGEFKVLPFPEHGLQEVVSGTPAEEAGLRAGDKIIQIDGNNIQSFDDLVAAVQSSEGRPLSLNIDRNGQSLALMVAPKEVKRRNPSTGDEEIVYQLGVRAPWERLEYSLIESSVFGVTRTWDTVVLIGDMLGKLVTGQGRLDDIGGPIRIAEISKDVGESGALPILGLMALLSVNLGLLNLLPIPVLDGGHLLFYMFEMVLGKPLNARIQEIGLRIGLSLLLCLMIFFTINDIINLFSRKFGID